MNAPQRSDRGLSDLVAFVLTFAVIIASVAVVSTTGLGHLGDLRDAEQVRSAERAMQEAASDLDALDQGTPARVLSFSIDDRSVWVNETAIAVNVTISDGSGWTTSRVVQVNAIEQRFDRPDQPDSVTYESGAVMRSDAARLAYRPEFHTGEDAVIITLVNLTTDRSIQVSGGYSPAVAVGPRQAVPGRAPATDPDSTVQLLAEANRTEETVLAHRQLADGTDGYVRVDVAGSANPVQWTHYLETNGWDAVDGERFVFESDRATETILVRRRTIELS